MEVARNIGKESKKWFGEVGTVHEVINGVFTDLGGDVWDNLQSFKGREYIKGYSNVNEINKDLYYDSFKDDVYRTLFKPNDDIKVGDSVIIIDAMDSKYINKKATVEEINSHYPKSCILNIDGVEGSWHDAWLFSSLKLDN